MGRQSDPEIIAAYGLYPSTELQQFIQTQGEKMVKISHQPDITYEFKILDSPIVNAFAVPGGYVYFTRGIMAHFNSEAEFAGVLGHEIGHVAARHSAKQYSRAMVAQLGITIGTLASEKFAQFSDIATTGASLLFLKYGRDAERQSDKLGVEYSTKVGFDAHAMAGFFNTLQQMQNGNESLPTFLSTHPDPGEREKNVADLTTKWQRKEGKEDYKINHNSYLKMIDGLIYGDDPRQGYVVDQMFYHPEMKFNFPVPPNWTLENTPQQVNMISPSKDAMIVLGLSPEKNLENAVNTLVNQFGLELKDSKRAQINNFQAINIRATQTSEGQNLFLNIFLIQDSNRIYQFLGITMPEQFSELIPVTEKLAHGFNRLSDPSKINVQPRRIAIKEIKTTSSLSDALTEQGVPKNELNEHALLNGMNLNQSMEKGTLFKVITGKNFSGLSATK